MNVTSGTIARTVCLILALLNQVLAVLGKGTIAIAEDDIYQIVSLIATIIMAVAAWWKNNSFTKAAISADEVLRQSKLNE